MAGAAACCTAYTHNIPLFTQDVKVMTLHDSDGLNESLGGPARPEQEFEMLLGSGRLCTSCFTCGSWWCTLLCIELLGWVWLKFQLRFLRCIDLSLTQVSECPVEDSSLIGLDHVCIVGQLLGDDSWQPQVLANVEPGDILTCIQRS